MNNEEIKNMVREKYSAIANQSREQNEKSCCGAGESCCGVDYTIFSDHYEKLKGYNPDADLGLGCGIPTEFAMIRPGDTVVDLGSGAGNDCFVARALTGIAGRVIGIDMTENMINKARQNAEKLGFQNVEFRLGDIEKMPLTANVADVVISNCVLNLVPDKEKAFAEINRILKPGGHISVSDVVLRGDLPDTLKNTAEMYAGCVSGAIELDNYLTVMEKSGLVNIRIRKQKQIMIPDNILLNYMSQNQLDEYKNSDSGIFSITVYAEKPAKCCCEKC